jgi:PTS system nitrogen regulatory IIA component
MRIVDLFSRDRIIPRLRAHDKADALRKLASHLAQNAQLPARTVMDAVLECSDLPAFGPGNGFVLAHAFIPTLKRPLAVLARLDPAVELCATDGIPIDLVVLLLSPMESTGDHLRALASIAGRLRDPATRDLLRESKCRDSMYIVLLGKEYERTSDIRQSAGTAI